MRSRSDLHWPLLSSTSRSRAPLAPSTQSPVGAAGLALFLPLFILGGMGAGDVKLLAAIGAWLGPVNAVETAVAAGVIGGVLALGLALTRSYASQAFANIWSLLLYWRAAGIRPHPTLTLERHDGPRLAYAVPISIGAMVAVWV